MSEIPAKPAVAPFVVKIETFADHRGAKIEQRTLVSGVLPPQYPLFVGASVLAVPNSAGGLDHYPLQFVIHAATLDEALLRYAEARDAEKMKFVTAHQGEPDQGPGLLGPGGVPLRRKQ